MAGVDRRGSPAGRPSPPPGFAWLRGLLGPRIVHLAYERGQRRRVRVRQQSMLWIYTVCGQRAVVHMPEVPDTTRCPDCAAWAANWAPKITP
jgi:hypothetical protein